MSPGHFPSALHSAVSSHDCSPSGDLLAFHEHPHEVPLEAHSHVLGPAHPKMVNPPISGPADIRSFNRLLWPPSDVAISHQPSSASIPSQCTGHLRTLFIVWLPKGKECRLLTVAFPRDRVPCWQGLARALKEGTHRVAAHPSFYPPFTILATNL